MSFTVTLDVVVVAWILWRQLRVRPVWRRLTLRVAAILGVIGLIDLLSYTGSHRVSGDAAAILTASFLVGALGLGALRAATVKIWRAGPVVLRQGTWVTIGLWVASLGLHYGAQAWIDAIKGPGGLVSASLLLWLAVTYGVQTAVVHHRAEGLLAETGGGDGPGGRWWAGRWVGSPGPGGPGGPAGLWGQGGGWGGNWPGGHPQADAPQGVIDVDSQPVAGPDQPPGRDPGGEQPSR